MSEVRHQHRWLLGAIALAVVAAGVTAGFIASTSSARTGGSTRLSVPRLIGLPQRLAVVELHARGIAYRIEPSPPYVTSLGQQPGTVLAQSPSSGTFVGGNERVIVFVSTKPSLTQVPATASDGRLLSAISIDKDACTMAPARADVSPTVPLGVAIARASTRGLIMMRVTGRAGGAPRVVAFYGMLQCSMNLPRHRALAWLVEYPNDRILNLNGPFGSHPTPFIGTMFVVVNPRSGISNESFGGPTVTLKRD